jgi:hypothetical protein
MQFKSFMEALKGKQHKIDKNKNGEIDAHDFKLLRKEEEELEEANVEEMQEQFKVGDFVKDHTGKIHRVFGVNGTNLETGIHYGKDKYGGTNNLHTSKAKKVPTPQDVKEESEERMARADYKVGASGRKSHKEIVFNDAESKDDDKKEMKEAKMSDADMAERERIVKGMKKNLTGFKARYGDKAKEVMYATATKQAMKEETVEEAVQKVDIPAYLRKQQGQTPLKLSDLKRKDTISDKENLAKLRNEELDEAMINGREYASHGLMHPDHAAHAVHKVTGQSIDFYAHGTGDKVEGKVTKNDGKAVHIKDTKGKTHQFKVQRGLPTQQNEEKKDDVPFDGPYTKTKPVKNSDGTTQQPMSRARQLAKDAMKKQMKEDIDRLFEKDEKEYGYEGDMAMNQLSTLVRCAEMIKDTLKPDTDLPEWVQSKITLATDYIVTAADYLHSELEEGYYEKPASAYRRKGDEIGGGSNVPVAPVPDRKYIKGTPEHKAYKATKKPINGMPTNVKESFDADGNIVNSKVSYKEFAMMLEYEAKDGVYRNKGTYGGSYTDPEGADDADDKKPKQQPAVKRGRGRPAGAKSGAGKITGTSKLYK